MPVNPERMIHGLRQIICSACMWCGSEAGLLAELQPCSSLSRSLARAATCRSSWISKRACWPNQVHIQYKLALSLSLHHITCPKRSAVDPSRRRRSIEYVSIGKLLAQHDVDTTWGQSGPGIYPQLAD
eukprot:15485446-Alexandrium_andersonii.AAC.1